MEFTSLKTLLLAYFPVVSPHSLCVRIYLSTPSMPESIFKNAAHHSLCLYVCVAK
jgi:hypothetical protein